MTTYDLMIKVKDILEENGFETSSSQIKDMPDYAHQARATKDNKSQWIPVEEFSYSQLYGFTVDFDVVYRRNATEQNASVDVSVYEWKRSSGRRLAKERITVHMSDKQILNRVNKIIAKYNEL